MPSSSVQFTNPKAAGLAQVIQVLAGVEKTGTRLVKFSQQGQTLRLLLAIQDQRKIDKIKRKMTYKIDSMAGDLKGVNISVVQVYYNPNKEAKPEALTTVHLNHTPHNTDLDPFVQLSRCLCMAR